MDTSKISFGEVVAAASAVALLVFMFLPWYGVEASAGGNFNVSQTANAWRSFDFIDILLLLVVIATVGLVAARAGGAMPSGLPAPGLLVAGAGALALLLILFRIIDTPGESASVVGASVDISRKIGVFLGLIAAAGITFGGYTAANERASGQAPPG